MDNTLLTLLCFPIIIGVIILVVEYWIIIPFRKKLEERKERPIGLKPKTNNIKTVAIYVIGAVGICIFLWAFLALAPTEFWCGFSFLWAPGACP